MNYPVSLNEVNTYIIYMICKSLIALPSSNASFVQTVFAWNVRIPTQLAFSFHVPLYQWLIPRIWPLRKGLHQAKCGRFTILENFIDPIITRTLLKFQWVAPEPINLLFRGRNKDWDRTRAPPHKLQRPVLGDKQP